MRVFLDPAEKALYPDWDLATAGLVAGFRRSVGSDVDDQGFVQLVGELSLSSERFRRLWARHDVLSFEGAPVRLEHPQVGELILGREKLAIAGTDGQLLVIYHAQPGTSSAEKLALLASLANSTATVASDAVPQLPTALQEEHGEGRSAAAHPANPPQMRQALLATDALRGGRNRRADSGFA